jgi:HSP20 family protein
MSQRWNPLQDLISLQDRMNRLFADATQRRAREEADPSDEIETAEWYPPADVYEDEANYLIAIDLPGVDSSELEIDIDDNRLTIKGKREVKIPSSRPERPGGRFLRKFSVPTSIEQQNIRAEYRNGVLEVRLPKVKAKATQRIEIKVS